MAALTGTPVSSALAVALVSSALAAESRNQPMKAIQMLSRTAR
jgi:hypothetical protein